MLTVKNTARRRRKPDGNGLQASRASDAVSKAAPIYQEFSVGQWQRMFKERFRLQGRSLRPPYMASKNEAKGYIKFLNWVKFHDPPFDLTP